ncbi:uncharacterized protein MELLADRAFT_87104 [Melampsora larici-populina 98AG31]|uniref:Uncharacterized protein n=1 Tax=Melampsora larici-populina (strain 98AG31 / pathotype 3-4-7) TaxID=747676 RepID=F4R4I4_MELLP|nr:uncharacterized protein MELLADRAFT_87104 [Melampsora larici-populina 98AG31]EGG12995.1 hypothetical protein MELLADRAFT_87104 [Melampsora larici-populina 98AG31]
MTSSIKNQRASIAPPSTKQKRKKRRRATSVLSTESRNRQGSVRPADDELAMVKAAAMKLLDNTSDQIIPNIDLDMVIGPVDLRDRLQDSSLARPIKKIKFEDVSSELDQLTSTHLTHSGSSRDLNDKENQPDPIHKPNNKKKTSCGPSLLRQCIDPLAKSQDEIVSDTYEDKGERFEVKLRDIFAKNAIVNAFQATLNEFRYYHRNRGVSSEASESLLPLTESQRRSTSLLYYGTPRPTPPASFRKKKASKRPKLETFVPNSRTSSENTLPVSAPRQPSPVLSDLDMEEYLEMFGDFIPPEVLNQKNTINTSEKESVEASSSSAVKVTTTPITTLEGTTKEDEEEEMMISQNSSKANSPIPFNHSTLSSSSTTRTTPVPAHPSIIETPINPSLESSLELQKQSLTNALNAQYWAGYYTAIYHQSVGFTLPNAAPIQGASSKSLPCPPDSINKTGWEAGKNAGYHTNPSGSR